MPNTLTGLIPSLYEALDVVSREMVGIIPAVRRDTAAERAAVGQSILVPITPSETTADTTPAVTPPNTGDATVGNVTVSITKSKHVPIRHTGEERRGLQTAGTFSTIFADRAYQAMRALVNEMEADLWTEIRTNASRAFGTAGTTPFGTAANMSDFAGVRRILEENGAPTNDLQLVLGHAAMANLRGLQSGLFRVNEAGSADMLRNGMTDRIMGMAIRHSDAVGIHTKGTGTSYLVNNTSTILVGGTTVAADTGSGTIIAGDVVTFAADSVNKYVVGTALSGGSFVLNSPGIRTQAIPDNNAITVGNNFTANLAFARTAAVLVQRPPALPEGGDMAQDITTITDPVSGLSFEVAVYPQFMQTSVHIRCAWGVKAIKDEHIAILLG